MTTFKEALELMTIKKATQMAAATIIEDFINSMKMGGVEVKINYEVDVVSVDLDTYNETIGKMSTDNKFSGGGDN